MLFGTAFREGNNLLHLLAMLASCLMVGYLICLFRKQRALQKSQAVTRDEKERMHAIFDALGDAIGVISRDFKVIYQNERQKSLVGAHEGQTCYRSFHGRESACGDCPLLITFNDGSTHTAIRRHPSSANDIYLEVTASPLRDATGAVFAAIEIVRDVTERVQTEQALRESEAAFKTQMDAMPVGAAWIDSDDRFEYLNRSFVSLFGYSREDIPTTEEWCRRAFPDPRYRAEVIAATNEAIALAQTFGTLVRPHEIRITCKDGTVRHVIHNCQLTDTRRLLVFTDITERKIEEASLRRLNGTLKTILTCNDLLVRARNKRELLENICRVIREAGNFRLVRVDFAENALQGKVHCVAQDGCEERCTSGGMQREGGLGPAETAMHNGVPCLVKDVRNDPRCALWSEMACQHGYLSVLSVPLINGSEILGALTIDAAHTGAFDEEEASLMVQLAGNLAYGIVSMRTAEEHRVMQGALGKSEKNLAEAQAIAHLGSWEIDVEKDEEYRSAEFYRILGMMPRTLGRAPDSVFEYIHRDDKERVLTSITETLERGAPYDIEYRIVRLDGAERTVHARGKTLRNRDGKITRFIGTVLDITERKAAEEAFRASERRFRQLLEEVRLAAVIFDTDGTVTFCNDFLLSLTGWNKEEVLGANGIDTFIPLQQRERAREEFAGEATGEMRTPLEMAIVTREGRLRDVIWNRTVLRDAEEHVTGLACIGIDVTDHRKLEQQLRQAQKMEAIGQLAGGVAHDFNNMLTVIAGYGQLLRMDEKLEDRQRESLDQILLASEKAAQLTSGLLAFSRKQVLDFKTINLNEVVQNVQKFLVRIVGEDVQVKSSFHEAPLFINADRGQTEQVLINLVTNARDAMPKGGVLTIGTELQEIDDSLVSSHDTVSTGRFAVLTVADSGTGMDLETQKRIFEPFFTTKEVGKGTGLGMSIVFGIVEQHQGFINLYSEPGTGTVFKVYIPCVDQVAAHETSSNVELPQGGSETILVAEDDAAICALIENILTRFGYEVILAQDGKDAVQKFRVHQDRVKLVLMDMIMPGKSGTESYEEIRQIRNVKVLYSSGYTMEIIRSRSDLDEESDIIMKPIQPRELLRKIREVLDRPAPAQLVLDGISDSRYPEAGMAE